MSDKVGERRVSSSMTLFFFTLSVSEFRFSKAFIDTVNSPQRIISNPLDFCYVVVFNLRGGFVVQLFFSHINS